MHLAAAGRLTLGTAATFETRVGAGPGDRFIKTATFYVQGSTGIAYVNEKFQKAAGRSFISAVLAEELGWKLTDKQLPALTTQTHLRPESSPGVQRRRTLQAFPPAYNMLCSIHRYILQQEARHSA